MAGLSETPRGQRLHIGVFGRTNAGKSTLINTICGGDVSLVSCLAGTTTDPVYKSMELHPAGPVVLIDTPGLDDTSEIGERRINRTMEVLRKTDLAVLVVPENKADFSSEKEYLGLFQKQKVPAVVIVNRCDGQKRLQKNTVPDIAGQKAPSADLSSQSADPAISNAAPSEKAKSEASAPADDPTFLDTPALFVDVADPASAAAVREFIVRHLPADESRSFTGDLVSTGDTVVLVMPQDIQAPKGRLILPQVQVLRDLLDNGCNPYCTTPGQLADVLENLKNPPALVITDSQMFREVDSILPKSIRLTSFSILLSKEKGDIAAFIGGAKAIDRLQDGDRVLVMEACTHHAMKGDIAREKLPAWISKYTGKALSFETFSGPGLPDDLGRYALVLHCGGCMINRKNMLSRLQKAGEKAVPVTNFGTAIAFLNGILDRVCY